jgi:hypothetical protein
MTFKCDELVRWQDAYLDPAKLLRMNLSGVN